MELLGTRDVERALAIVAAAASSGNGEPFGLETVDAVADAIPADATAYVEWRFGARDCLRVSRGSEGQEIDDFDAALSAGCQSYPLRDVDWSCSPEIARRLFISPATVRTHLEHVFEKLGVRSRTAAVRAAFIAA